MVMIIVLSIIGIVVCHFILKKVMNNASKIVLVLTTFLVLALFWGCTEYGYIPSGKRFVHVQGYYRKDGTYVSSYTRSYPGEKNKSAGNDYRGYFIVAMITVVVGGVWFAGYIESSRNINNRPGGTDGSGGDENYYVKADKVDRGISDNKNGSLLPVTARYTPREPTDEDIPVLDKILSFNSIFGDDIVVQISSESLYPLSNALNQIIFHDLLEAGCPQIKETQKRNRIYLYEVEYRNKLQYYHFTYSSDPSRSYGHVSFDSYIKLRKKTLETFGVMYEIVNGIQSLYFENPREKITIKRPAHEWYYNYGLPTEYCFIYVRNIYRDALKRPLKKQYDKLRESLKEDWKYEVSGKGYEIYRTKNKQTGLKLSKEETDLISSAKSFSEKWVKDLKSKDMNKINEIYKEMDDEYKKQQLKRYSY